jgi:hypothetical protein
VRHHRAQLENPQNINPHEMELFFWNYKFVSGILRKQFKTHQEYLDFGTDLIDKIGMNSMVVETDMAGNYVACPTVEQLLGLGQVWLAVFA